MSTLTGHSGKSTHVSSLGPHCDGPSSCGNLDAYDLQIRSIESNINYYGDAHDVIINMELRTIGSNHNASGNIQSFETLLKDLEILNKIKKANHPGIVELWEQLQTLMVLTKKTDK